MSLIRSIEIATGVFLQAVATFLFICFIAYVAFP